MQQKIQKDRENSTIDLYLRSIDFLVYNNSGDQQAEIREIVCVRTYYPNDKWVVIIRLLTACIGPVRSNFPKSIKRGFFIKWPGLSEKLVSKYLNPTTVPANGYLAQTRKGFKSTKKETDRCDNLRGKY